MGLKWLRGLHFIPLLSNYLPNASFLHNRNSCRSAKKSLVKYKRLSKKFFIEDAENKNSFFFILIESIFQISWGA